MKADETPGRWYIICTDREAPWVLAEAADGPWASDMALTFGPSIALPREEALLDPDYRGAVLAWESKDDRTYAAWRAQEVAEMALYNAIEGTDDETREQWSEEVWATVNRPDDNSPDERAVLRNAVWHVKKAIFEAVGCAKEKGFNLDDDIARIIARDAKSLVRAPVV
jgi:hypothetical protein